MKKIIMFATTFNIYQSDTLSHNIPDKQILPFLVNFKLTYFI